MHLRKNLPSSAIEIQMITIEARLRYLHDVICHKRVTFYSSWKIFLKTLTYDYA